MGKYYLYLALYDIASTSSQGLRIHWALLLSPKHQDPRSLERTTRLYHAINKMGQWSFELRYVECIRSQSMLGRVLLGSIDEKDEKDADSQLQRTPVRAQDERWNCRKWVEEALVALLSRRLLQVKHGVEFGHLYDFARRFAAEVVEKGLNVGHDLPVTVEYPGPGRIPSKIVK